MSALSFEAIPYKINDWLIIKLPDDTSAALPSRGQVMSQVILEGKSYQTVLEPDGRGGHWFRVTREMPATTSEPVVVKIEPTKDWPEPALPEDFASALSAKPDIAAFFKTITPMAKWEWVRWIDATNVAATREKRIIVSIDKLRKGMRRPCCFNRAACTRPEVSKNAQLIELTTTTA